MKISAVFTAIMFLGSINLAFAGGDNIELSSKNVQECVAVELWTISGKHINKDVMPNRTVKIPEGWTVVGGSGGGDHPTIAMCRDL
jgi:hypothetical protein